MGLRRPHHAAGHGRRAAGAGHARSELSAQLHRRRDRPRPRGAGERRPPRALGHGAEGALRRGIHAHPRLRAHQELQYPNRVLEFLFYLPYKRNARVDSNSNSDDRCQRQKQGGAVGAAASRMRVPPKARCSRWEPRPGFLFCAARAIHPRPPKNRNVSKYAAVFIYNSDIFTSPACQSSWARILFCTISPAGVRARMRPSKVAYPARTQFCTKASCAVENCLPYRVL